MFNSFQYGKAFVGIVNRMQKYPKWGFDVGGL